MASPKNFFAILGMGLLLFVGTGPLFADLDDIPPPPDGLGPITTDYEIPKTPYEYQVPRELSDGWKVVDLRKEKADLANICKGVNRIRSRLIPSVNSLLVVRHGKLVMEEYFNGKKAEEPQALYSCTKSVFSTIYGIAQDQGLLNLDQKIYDSYPEERSKPEWDLAKNAITVGMLLSMTSGFDCNDVMGNGQICGAAMAQAPDWLNYCLALPLAHPPGKVWTYNGACLSLLSNLIVRDSGMSFPAYADQILMKPLGIDCGTWVTNPAGVSRVDYGLYWKARDMAKLGQLYLNRGLWEGKRIVSEAWVKDATAVHAPPGEAFGHDYGYLWHIKTLSWKGRPLKVFYANGYMGQEIYVAPDADLVCVMTAASTSPNIYSLEEDLFENQILASFN